MSAENEPIPFSKSAQHSHDGSIPMYRRVEVLERRSDEQDDRLDVLERDKAYVLGICAAVGVLVGLALGILTVWGSMGGPK